MLRISIGDDQVYVFDDDKMMLSEAKLVTKYSGKSVKELFANRGELDSLQAMVFLAKFRAGEQPKWSDIDFDLSTLDVTPCDEQGNPLPDEPDEPAGDGQGNEPEPAAPSLSVA